MSTNQDSDRDGRAAERERDRESERANERASLFVCFLSDFPQHAPPHCDCFSKFATSVRTLTREEGEWRGVGGGRGAEWGEQEVGRGSAVYA